MTDAVEGLRPEGLWRRFADISRIPRPSGSEEAVARHVLETAARLGHPAKRDDAGNVVVAKPASPGREGSRGICLQAHLDMVCVKEAGSARDPGRDPIELVRKGEWIAANGTTLGADDGIGVAAMLAILEDASLVHGPLELLFTVDEERGLVGAGRLRSDFVRARTLINLDNDEEGALCIGCAGGKTTTGIWTLEVEEPPAGCLAAEVRVRELRGGHSGTDIHKGRGNAIKILARALLRVQEAGGRISRLEGGSASNSIPSEASAAVVLRRTQVRRAEGLVRKLGQTLRSELGAADAAPSLDLSLLEGPPGAVLRRHLQKKILRALEGMPHGIVRLSPDVPGLVETSTNVAVLSTGEDVVRLVTSQRSSVESALADVEESVACIFRLAGAKAEAGGAYPGWRPDPRSAIVKVARAAHRDLTGKDAEVQAVHAGLECGVIGERLPGMDMVSLGPVIQDAHTAGERLSIPSVERFWSWLVRILERAG